MIKLILFYAREALGAWNRSAVPSVVLSIVLVVYLVHQLRQVHGALESVDHSDQVIARGLTLQNLMLDAETGVRGYLLTRDPSALAPYNRARDEWASSLEQTEIFVSDNRAQSDHVRIIGRFGSRWFEAAAKLQPRTDFDKGREIFGLGEAHRVMDAIRNEVGRFIADEHALREKRDSEIERRIPRIVISTAAASLFLRILGLFLWRRLKRDN